MPGYIPGDGKTCKYRAGIMPLAVIVSFLTAHYFLKKPDSPSPRENLSTLENGEISKRITKPAVEDLEL